MSETDDKFREPLDVTERVWEFSLKFEHGFFNISNDELLVQSKIASRQLARTLVDMKREIAVSIRELSRQISKLLEDVEYLERAEQIASEQLDLARLSYEEGLITNRDLITAENDHTAARIEHIRAIYDYLSAVSSLDRALGK
jgi:outer membrane protein TolC